MLHQVLVGSFAQKKQMIGVTLARATKTQTFQLISSLSYTLSKHKKQKIKKIHTRSHTKKKKERNLNLEDECWLLD
jgi:hypothetical protein